ncbi:uncharacterized protein LOC134801117 [Cydia splendana]|uniref:uncharacterized protein LOC134801117 n=1 Tax=Cydia splendana TaxID=1100963 RepID=UPI00300D3FED
MNDQDKICVILFDEMALKKRLILNTTTDKIDGFQDLGNEGGRSADIADHALVFMLQGVRKKYKQPLAHYFVKGTVSSERLSVIIKTIIQRVVQQGFSVIGTVCDQGPTNMGALNLLKRLSGISIDANYFLVDGTKFFTVYDIPHLFKSIRNNFLQGGEVLWDIKKGKWKHLIELEEKNRNTLHFMKISKRAVLPKYKSKMKVKLAAQILSNTVSAILKLQAESVDDTAKNELMQTAEVIEDLDQLFDCTNGPASYKDIKKNKRENVSKKSFHHNKWRTYKEKLKSLKFLKAGNNVTLKNVRCVKGYIISISSLQDIWDFVNARGMKYLNLRQLNQDSLENLFGLIRQHSPTNRNPTCYHFGSALKSSILTRLSSPALRGANCEQDDNRIIFDFHDVVFGTKKEKGNEQQIQEPHEQISPEDDVPVLHLAEDLEEDEDLVNFDNQPAVYVSGFVAKKILNGLTCSRCCSVFQADEQTGKGEYRYIYLREWDKNDIRLTYPSIALCNQIMVLTKVFEENIKTMLYVSGVTQYSKTIMLGSIDTSWLCPEHFADCAEKLAVIFSMLLLRNECRRQNDVFSLGEENTADVLKKAEQGGTAK